MKLSNRAVTRFNFTAPDGWTQQPRAQQTRAHSGHRFVDYFKQGSRAFAEPFNQFEVANGDAVEHQMILRLEINDVSDVRGGCALSLLGITKTCARGANRFGLLRQSVAIQRPRTELLQ